MRILRAMLIMICSFAMLFVLAGCNTWQWHASERMVGSWEIIAIETRDGELFWEHDKVSEYGFYFDFLNIGEDGSFSELKDNMEDTVTLIGTWVTEEEQGVARILVTLSDGAQFEIAWTNEESPYTDDYCTIRYGDATYDYIFKAYKDDSK